MRSSSGSPLEAKLEVWREDFRLYAEEVLRIVTKDGDVVPFVLNPIQREIHEALSEQRARTGSERAVILKARQQGASTVNVLRYYWLCALSGRPLNAYVLTHRQEATFNLIAMATRVGQLAPHPALVPRTTRSNKTELAFANGSLIQGHTASVPTAGRSGTVHLFLSSEAAHQEHAGEHILGTTQQVPTHGSSIIIESTACGAVGAFYDQWREESDYLKLFFPWFREAGYTLPHAEFSPDLDPPNDFTLSEYEYQQRYGLSDQQMAWRRMKVKEMFTAGIDGWAGFAQEYPADADEAFGRGSLDSFISPRHVAAAKHLGGVLTTEHLSYGLIVGVDPAPAHGGSNTAIAFRRGPVCHAIRRLGGMENLAQCEHLLELYKREQPVWMVVDDTEGTGITIVEFLRSHGCRVLGVKFGNRARRPDKYHNRRAEIWSLMSQWFANGASIPREYGRHDLSKELLAVKKLGQNELVVQLEKKTEVIKRLGFSPDGADALALTFAVPEPLKDAGASKVVTAPPPRLFASRHVRGRGVVTANRPRV